MWVRSKSYSSKLNYEVDDAFKLLLEVVGTDWAVGKPFEMKHPVGQAYAAHEPFAWTGRFVPWPNQSWRPGPPR